jgi:hypothetical protein
MSVAAVRIDSDCRLFVVLDEARGANCAQRLCDPPNDWAVS